MNLSYTQHLKNGIYTSSSTTIQFIESSTGIVELTERVQKTNFVKDSKNDFGKDAIACLGDSSRKQCFKWQISKGVGLRKVFYRNGIKCFLIDKKYTSKRCGVCGDGTEQDVARINENKRSAHTLLQCSKSHFCESGGRQTFMHRDVNGSLNILRTAKCY